MYECSPQTRALTHGQDSKGSESMLPGTKQNQHGHGLTRMVANDVKMSDKSDGGSVPIGKARRYREITRRSDIKGLTVFCLLRSPLATPPFPCTPPSASAASNLMAWPGSISWRATASQG